MSDTPVSAKPISVKASAAPIITEEAAKTVIVAGVTIAASQFVHSEQALAYVLPVAAVVANGAVSAWQRLHTWGVLKKLAGAVSDDIAVIGNPGHGPWGPRP